MYVVVRVVVWRKKIRTEGEVVSYSLRKNQTAFQNSTFTTLSLLTVFYAHTKMVYHEVLGIANITQE